MTIAPELALLTVTTVRIDDPGPLLALLPAQSPLAWVTGEQGLVGWGEAARLDLTGPGRFAQAEDWWRALTASSEVRDGVGLPGCGLVCFGSFSFDPLAGSSTLIVPEVLVGHRDDAWWLTTVNVAPPRLAATDAPVAPGTVRFSDGARSSTAWTEIVAGVVARIAAGDAGKVVLARDLEARLDAPLDVRWPLQRLAEGYPGCWTFSVDGLFGATPELLVRLEEGVATSLVLAGTLRRGDDRVGDHAQGSLLSHSSKDLEEHDFAVRSVAASLAAHCTGIDAPDRPFLLHLKNVMHLASVVTGTVADASTSFGLLASLHPSAAVCGTPTPAALALIREVEGLDRARYAGPVGWTGSSGDGEWGIALRCAEVDPRDPTRVRLFAGAGIVAGSQPEAELAETAAKLVPMCDALQG